MAIGGEQRVAVVQEGEVAAEEHGAPPVERGAERGGDGAVDAVGASVAEDFRSGTRGVREPLEVADGHAAPDEEAVVRTEGGLELSDDAAFERPVDRHDLLQPSSGGGLGFLPAAERGVGRAGRHLAPGRERAIQACPAAVRRVRVLARPSDQQHQRIRLAEPPAQRLARRQRSHHHDRLGRQRLRGLFVAQDEVVGRDQPTRPGQVTAEGAGTVGQDRPAGQLGELLQGPGALVAVGEGMRTHDDRAPLGAGEEAGHHGRGKRRLDLSGGRQGREGLEIEAWRGLEAFFRLGGR